jgi:hypothetical protein
VRLGVVESDEGLRCGWRQGEQTGDPGEQDQDAAGGADHDGLRTGSA